MRSKIKKALKLVNLTPTQKEHIISNLPQSAVDKLTSKELAELMMAMHKHYHQGKAEAEKEIAQHIGVPKGTSIWEIEI
jgi:uncharacterized membrane protein